MPDSEHATRYTTTAIALHWLIATAVVGLWSVYSRSLHRAIQARQAGDLDTLQSSVTEDVSRAADVLTRGL